MQYELDEFISHHGTCLPDTTLPDAIANLIDKLRHSTPLTPAPADAFATLLAMADRHATHKASETDGSHAAQAEKDKGDAEHDDEADKASKPMPAEADEADAEQQPDGPDDSGDEGESDDGYEADTPRKQPRVAKKTPEDIIKECKRGQQKSGSTKQYEKPGNFDDTLKDFERLRPTNVTTKGPFRDGKIVKVGKLPDGRIVIARSTSSGKLSSPTLEFQNNPGFRGEIKIRYI